MKKLLLLFFSTSLFCMEYVLEEEEKGPFYARGPHLARYPTITPSGNSILLCGISLDTGISVIIDGEPRYITAIGSDKPFAPNLSPSGQYIAYVEPYLNLVRILDLQGNLKHTIHGGEGYIQAVYFLDSDFKIKTISYVNRESNDCYHRKYILKQTKL